MKVMAKKIKHLEEIGTNNPFKVPEGYFEGLTNQIMEQLPEKYEQEIAPVSLWQRVKPWVYMAAMFAGIALMIKTFVGSPDSNKGLNLTSSVDIEEFYSYYEDQFASIAYHESLYLDELYIEDTAE